MKTWTLKQRITIGFAALCIMLAGLSGLSILRMRSSAASAKEMTSVYTVQDSLAARVFAVASEGAIAMRGYDNAPSEATWQAASKKLEETEAASAAIESFSREHPELTTLRADLEQANATYRQYKDSSLAYHEATSAFQGAWADMVPAGGRLFDVLSVLLAEVESVSKTEAQEGTTGTLAKRALQLRELGDAYREAAEIRLACWRAMSAGDPAMALAANKKTIATAERLKALRAGFTRAENIARADECLAALAVYQNGTLTLQKAIEQQQSARSARGTAYFAFATEISDVAQNAVAAMRGQALQSETGLGQAVSMLVVGSALAVLLGIATAVVITRGTNRILSRIVGVLASGADETAASAQLVSAASQQLAAGASEQASSLEETSASLEEMAGTTHQNAENAGKAGEFTRQAREAADHGTTDMQEMAASMQAIKGSSDEIAKIIRDIDEIAFQTNILALNAAVEAARAGESGAGFAVVAGEVRTLAQRSASAAKEIAAKIDTALSRTAHGVEICAKVESRLGEIAGKIRDVDTLVNEVVAASKEQNTGTSQVSTDVAQMDKVTQDTAASAEECASAAEELSSQAVALQDAVNELQLLVHGDKVTTAPAAAPAPKKAHPVRTAAPAAKPVRSQPRASTTAAKPKAEALVDSFVDL
jgi:methyl-accepting chemotaxis protein